MPGQKVSYEKRKGQVISRGASRGEYFVEIAFDNPRRVEKITNNDIANIKAR